MTAVMAVRMAASEPEEGWLAAAVAGVREAQGAVARVYYPRMRRWALIECGDPQLAEEAVQEALVRWVRHARSYDLTQPFGPWMRTLVRNACRDVKRGQRRVLDFLPWGRRATSVERLVDLSRAASLALEQFAKLTPRQREVVDLIDLQGLTAAEAGQALDVSPQTVRVHLHDGHKRLADLMGGSISDVLKEGR